MMRLKEVAKQLAEEQLLNAEYFWHSVCSDDSFRTMDWETVLKLAASGEPLEELNAAELQVLRMHVALHGASPVEEENLLTILRRRSALTGAECRLALDTLERRGFLFALRKTWGERLIFVPSDLYAAILAGLSNPLSLSPCFDDVFPAAPLNTAHGIGGPLPLGRALVYCLSQLRREPSAGFTGRGILSQKMRGRLERAFPFSADVLEVFGFRARGEKRCSSGVALLLEAALGLRLLIDAEKGFGINEQALEIWLEQSDQARERELRNWLCGLIFPAAGPAAHCGAKMSWLHDGIWYRVQDLYIDEISRTEFSADRTLETGQDQRQFAQSWLDLFYACGWLESGYMEGDEAEPVFRWRNFSNTVENEVIIQPDGELLVGPHTGGNVRWQLEEIADRVSDDLFTLYRLSENRLHWKLGSGALMEEIRSILQAVSGQESLPEPVGSMLQQWHQSWEESGSRPASFRAGGKSASILGEPPPNNNAPQRSFLERVQPPPVEHYQLEKNRDAYEAFSEKIAAIPAMWLKQRRSYHHSTSRELIAKAISLETAVELSMEGGSVLFIPEASEQRGNQWMVSGKIYGDSKLENHVFGPEEWDEIRLVLPSGAEIGRKR